MKNILILSMLLSLFLSCNQSGKDKGGTVDSLAIRDSLKTAGKVELIGLTHDLAKDKELYINLYNNIKTSKDFKIAFVFAKKLESELDSIFGTIQSEQFDVIENKAKEMLGVNIPAMEVAMVAEGTMAAIMFNNKALLETAKKTAETDDDDFVNLLIESYGDKGNLGIGFGSWFNQTWDYGGGSKLGQGVHIKLLKQIDKMKSTGSNFISEGDIIKTSIYNDILEWKVYEEPAEAIVKEINDIMGLQNNTQQEQDKLKARIEQIKNAEKNGIQVNCKAGNCNYGG